MSFHFHRGHNRGRLGIAGEKVNESCFFGARLSWRYLHKWRIAIDQTLQGRLHIRQIFEVVKPFGTYAQLSWSLSPSKQKNAEHRDLAASKVELFVGSMLKLRDATVGSVRGTREPLILQSIKRSANGTLVERSDGLAIVLLIARVDKC